MTKLSDAIKKHRELTASIHQQDIEERRKYLQFCESEAERIYDALTDEILDDIESSGKDTFMLSEDTTISSRIELLA